MKSDQLNKSELIQNVGLKKRHCSLLAINQKTKNEIGYYIILFTVILILHSGREHCRWTCGVNIAPLSLFYHCIPSPEEQPSHLLWTPSSLDNSAHRSCFSLIYFWDWLFQKTTAVAQASAQNVASRIISVTSSLESLALSTYSLENDREGLETRR